MFKSPHNLDYMRLGSLLLLGMAFFVQFFINLGDMLKRWNEVDYTYCYLVPLIFVYLIYSKKQDLYKADFRPSPSGLFLLIISGFLYLAGNLGSIETLAYMAMWTTIMAFALLLFGFNFVRSMFYPFIVLAFFIPVPPFLNRPLTFQLKLISSAFSVKIMQISGLSVFREGNIIDIGVTQFQVVDACSGLRYFFPLLVMGFAFAFLFHRRWWERLIVIGATIPISVISNALRIAITGYITIHVSAEVAEGFYHGFSGWLIFMASFVFLAVLSRLFKKLPGQTMDKKDNAIKNGQQTGPFRLGNINFKYLLCASLIVFCFWGIKVTLDSTQIIPERKSFNEFPANIGDWKGERHFISDEVLKELWADDYLDMQFTNQKTGEKLLLFIPYYDYQGTMHTAHAPAACLIGGGYAPISSKKIQKTFLEPFGKVKVGQMVLEKDRHYLLSIYWFQMRGRIIANEYLNKWFLFWDSITKRRTDGALIRIEMPLRDMNELESAQKTVDQFILELMDILPEHIPD